VFFGKRAASLLSLCAFCCAGSALRISATEQRDANNPADNDLIPLLRQVEANRSSNNLMARQYVADKSTHTIVWNKTGKKIKDNSEKGEVVFANGSWYYRVVERNGVPLSAEKQVSLQKHLDAVSDRARGFDFTFDLRDGNPRDSIYSALPICCLAELFDNRLLRYEQVNGRDNLVVESTPKANADGASPHDRTALDWKETTWIDVTDLMPTRLQVELLNDKSFLLKGSTELREFVKMQFALSPTSQSIETVWLLQTKKDRSNLKFAWSYQLESFEDTSSNYRRFNVDVKVLANPAAALPSRASGSKP
jgi:hypothetical protein